jgi:hypothetical protein
VLLFLKLIRWIPLRVRRFVRTRILAPTFRTVRRARGIHSRRTALSKYSLEGHEVFAGYYDVQVYSADGGAILAHATSVTRRSLAPGDQAFVGYFDLERRRFHQLSQTTLWCWQMGARLRWWPGESRGLAFNCLIDGVAAYCLARPGRPLEKLADRPLFDVTRDGKVGVALNFGRLASARPGYGYVGMEDPFAGQLLPRGDGVTIVDLASGDSRLVAGISRLAELSGDADPNSFHYLTAASLSPGGLRFSVLHKCLADPSRPDLWTATAITGRRDGGDLRALPLPGTPSHYWWIDDEQIVFTSNVLGSNARSAYHVFDHGADRIQKLHDAAPTVDGHPSYHASSERWITDTYPNLYGEALLFVLNPDGTRQKLAALLSHSAYIGEWRCDLHPRWAPSGGAVVVDSTHEGKRAIYEVQVPSPETTLASRGANTDLLPESTRRQTVFSALHGLGVLPSGRGAAEVGAGRG